MKNQFYWYHDGTTINKLFKFRDDNTYMYNKNKGLWRILDSKTLWLQTNRFNSEYTLKFIDDFGQEAILIKPAKDPPSKMKIHETPMTTNKTNMKTKSQCSKGTT